MEIDITKLNQYIKTLSDQSLNDEAEEILRTFPWRTHKCDPVTIGSYYLSMLSNSYHQIAFNDLIGFYDLIHLELSVVYDNAITYINDLNGEVANHYRDTFYDTETDYDDLVAMGKGYNPKLFLRAIDNLKNNGVQVYVTNWGKFLPEIWDEYRRLMDILEP